MKVKGIKEKLVALAKERHGENITPLVADRDFVFDPDLDCFIYAYELPNKSSCAVIATYNAKMYETFHDDEENNAIFLED